MFIPISMACEEKQENTNSREAIEAEILRLINEHRSSNNMEQLEMNGRISESAADHVDYMLNQGEISHDNFSARSKELMDALDGRGIAENVAYGYPSAEAAVEGWLKSPGHRENIEGKYNTTGIAVKTNEDGVQYFCQIFMRL